MTCSQCVGIERFFDDRTARRELKRYRKKGPEKMTKVLLEALIREGAEGASFLEVGGGIGAIQHGLMEAGAAGGTSVDASPAYLEKAKEESAARGHADKVRYVAADFVDVQEGVDAADLVALDRVICCYPDMEALVDASAPKARRAYGVVYPRDTWLTRLVLGTMNFLQKLRRHPFRAFVHQTSAVEARVTSHGLREVFRRESIFWQAVVFRAGA